MIKVKKMSRKINLQTMKRNARTQKGRMTKKKIKRRKTIMEMEMARSRRKRKLVSVTEK